MELLPFYRAEVESVGRRWREVLASFDDAFARKRPAPDINCALWLTGHMAWAQDYFLLEMPWGRSARRKEWDSLYDFSSDKTGEEAYPPFEEVRGEFTWVLDEALKSLGGLSERDLRKACHSQRRWFPTVAHAIGHQVTHGHYHLGQLVYLDKLRQAGRL
jgi:hypothetical protein